MPVTAELSLIPEELPRLTETGGMPMTALATDRPLRCSRSRPGHRVAAESMTGCPGRGRGHPGRERDERGKAGFLLDSYPLGVFR